MARIDLSRFGTKYACYACASKFYDMNRSDPICPKCGANQKDAPVISEAEAEALMAKVSRPPKAVRPPRPPAIVDEADEEFESDDDGVAAAADEDDFDFDEDLDFGDDNDADDDDEEEEVP